MSSRKDTASGNDRDKRRAGLATSTVRDGKIMDLANNVRGLIEGSRTEAFDINLGAASQYRTKDLGGKCNGPISEQNKFRMMVAVFRYL